MTIKIFTVAEMVAAEKASDTAGNSYNQMMETAGRSVAEAIIQRYPVEEKSILVLVGPGNNGGDGLVAGRYLAQAGADVAFYLYKLRDLEKDHNFAQVQEKRLFIAEADFDPDYRILRARLNDTDLIIDSLLGTGVVRPIGGRLAELMKQVKMAVAGKRAEEQRSGEELVSPARPFSAAPPLHRSSALPVVAVDCPSGLNCDTGALDDLAMPAELTVTFAGPKRGHFIFPGAAACGELVVADIAIATDLPEVAAVNVELATAVYTRQHLPQRPTDGHKGTFGTALIAAGSGHYWGAPMLAGRAAYRVGTGLVALAVPQKIRATVAGNLPEATYPPVPDTEVFSAASLSFLQENVSAKAMLVGPGLDDAREFMTALLTAENLPPLVVDADGLNLLAQLPDWAAQLPPRTILTPHPGEMSRLMGIPLAELKGRDRVELAQEQAAQWGHIVLLKGAYTVVAEPNGRTHILPFANPALGAAGSGDVLSGVIVGLLAQGLEPYEAAVVGGYLHAAAAELYPGDTGLLAGELADLLPEVIQRLKNET
ncbi:MAG: NAD(P)H-hydrate dehydratase [Ardenticatenaceae bacterium]|nr:NAD(P)H-hydrate dehydratase [Ardenticatenaceae bacterium]MCB9444557.1 NAD(P)H-hydrate dehydratase [Ardenticatenaceae bacterium]